MVGCPDSDVLLCEKALHVSDFGLLVRLPLGLGCHSDRNFSGFVDASATWATDGEQIR